MWLFVVRTNGYFQIGPKVLFDYINVCTASCDDNPYD